MKGKEDIDKAAKNAYLFGPEMHGSTPARSNCR